MDAQTTEPGPPLRIVLHMVPQPPNRRVDFALWLDDRLDNLMNGCLRVCTLGHKLAARIGGWHR